MHPVETLMRRAAQFGLGGVLHTGLSYRLPGSRLRSTLALAGGGLNPIELVSRQFLGAVVFPMGCW